MYVELFFIIVHMLQRSYIQVKDYNLSEFIQQQLK